MMDTTSVVHDCPICGKRFYTMKGMDYAFKLTDSASKYSIYYCSWSCYRTAQEGRKKSGIRTGCRGSQNPWRIKYYEGDRLIAIGTAAELAEITGKPSGTIRIYALRRRRFKTGMMFEYEDAYYEHKKAVQQKSEYKEWDGVSDRNIHDMARESAKRHMSYGALQTEEYYTRHPSGIKVPEGYTSMRDREGKQ